MEDWQKKLYQQGYDSYMPGVKCTLPQSIRNCAESRQPFVDGYHAAKNENSGKSFAYNRGKLCGLQDGKPEDCPYMTQDKQAADWFSGYQVGVQISLGPPALSGDVIENVEPGSIVSVSVQDNIIKLEEIGSIVSQGNISIEPGGACTKLEETSYGSIVPPSQWRSPEYGSSEPVEIKAAGEPFVSGRRVQEVRKERPKRRIKLED